jgi:hypothetical protein
VISSADPRIYGAMTFRSLGIFWCLPEAHFTIADLIYVSNFIVAT